MSKLSFSPPCLRCRRPASLNAGVIPSESVILLTFVSLAAPLWTLCAPEPWRANELHLCHEPDLCHWQTACVQITEWRHLWTGDGACWHVVTSAKHSVVWEEMGLLVWHIDFRKVCYLHFYVGIKVYLTPKFMSTTFPCQLLASALYNVLIGLGWVTWPGDEDDNRHENK